MTMADEIEIPEGAEVEIELPEPESVVDETPPVEPTQVDERIEEDRWEKLFQLQKIQNEKMDSTLSRISENLENITKQNSDHWERVIERLEQMFPKQPENEPADVTPGEPPMTEPTGRRSKYARHGRRGVK